MVSIVLRDHSVASTNNTHPIFLVACIAWLRIHTDCAQKPAKKAAPKKKGRASRVVMDESEDEEEVK